MTKIQFQVPSLKFVKLVVYDLLGKEVSTLINEYKQPGTYQVSFNAHQGKFSGDLPSGVYFYRIEVKDSKSNKIFSETKSMIYLK
jgi:hypothetical protein